MKIRPLHDRVIVKRSEEVRTTASGIVIPDSATEKPDQGVVQAVGNGKRDDSGKLVRLTLKLATKCYLVNTQAKPLKWMAKSYW
jgi:chaperonin GroES